MRQNEILMTALIEEAQHEQETKAQKEYLQKQLGVFLKQKQQVSEEPFQSDPKRQKQVSSHTLDSSNKDEPLRMARPKPWIQANTNDFKVKILEYEGKLDPGEFLDWLHTIERVFEYKDVLEEKKVKLVALRLQKYVSL